MSEKLFNVTTTGWGGGPQKTTCGLTLKQAQALADQEQRACDAGSRGENASVAIERA